MYPCVVGRNAETWKGVHGKHGVGNCYDKGRILLELFADTHLLFKQLCISNTVFQQKDSLKTTWMHPRSKHWHMIDDIIVRQRALNDVVHTRVMPSAECHTDHRLICCKLEFQFKPKPMIGCTPRKKLNVSSLQRVKVRVEFENIRSKLETSNYPSNSPPYLLRDHIKIAILQASNETLGFSTKKNKDWFDKSNEEIQTMLATKRSAHQTHLAQASCPQKKAAFRLAGSTLQRKFRNIQNEWWTNLTERTQHCADTGDYRGFYQALKAV